jgi:hypothetical protein
MSFGWRGTTNRVMLSPDVGRLEIAVVTSDRVLPIARVTRSREPGSASAGHRPAADAPKRLSFKRRSLSTVSRPARCTCGRQAGDRHSLAPSGVQSLLALAVEAATRPRVPLEVPQLIREMSLANPLWGAPRATISGKRVWRSIWHGGEGHRRRAGGHFCATTRTASLQLICS